MFLAVNILGVLGLSSLFSPDGLIVSPAIFHFDLPVMVVVAFACLPIFFTGGLIARWEGMLFLLAYVAYVVYLVLGAIQHAQLTSYSTAMGGFVGPIVLVTLVVIAFREWHSRRSSG